MHNHECHYCVNSIACICHHKLAVMQPYMQQITLHEARAMEIQEFKMGDPEGGGRSNNYYYDCGYGCSELKERLRPCLLKVNGSTGKICTVTPTFPMTMPIIVRPCSL